MHLTICPSHSYVNLIARAKSLLFKLVLSSKLSSCRLCQMFGFGPQVSIAQLTHPLHRLYCVQRSAGNYYNVSYLRDYITSYQPSLYKLWRRVKQFVTL